jgi:hypothetical protein
MINESIKLEGYIVGLGKIKVDGTEEFEWLENPKHNRIVSTGLDHLMCYNGSTTGYFTSNTPVPTEPAMWVGNLNDHYGALSFCKIGTGKNETEFTDTDLQTPVGTISNTLKTGEPFCGTKCISEGNYVLRVSHNSNPVPTQCKIWEVGLFGQYGSGANKVNPMFARIKLDKGIELNAGERLIFTYDLHIVYADIEPVEDEDFCGLLDSVGEPLKYSRKIYFKFTKDNGAKYGDRLLRDLYITKLGEEAGYTINSENNYFFRLPVYYYNSVGTYGDYDSTGYSLQRQDFSVIDASLSKARAEALADNYTFDVLDYAGVGNKDKHRDLTICMGLYNPNMEEADDYSDIQFLRIRGMSYRFGYYTINEETGVKEWNEQSLRKWANQTMTFTIRTRYVTEDTFDINGEDPDAVEP